MESKAGLSAGWEATCVRNEPPSEGRCANCRSCPRLQKVEPVSHPQAFAFEIGRVGRSCVE